jgi:3-oxoacyl-[acyl-carrier-protein] synthase II
LPGARESIWITGVGCATSLGLDLRSLADNLLAGRSGIAPITQFDTAEFTCRIGATLPPLSSPPGWDPGDFAGRQRYIQVLLWCAVNALHDAGLWQAREKLRVGVVVGIGAEWLQEWERDTLAGGRAIVESSGNSSGLVVELAEALGVRGPRATVAAACASGNVALGVARQWLEDEWVDVVLAGGADLGVSPMSLGCFANLGALSKRNDAPTHASRPFDRDRDGFVMAEGGALLLLETQTHARRRSAGSYGCVLGYGSRSDAFHQVMPATDASFAAAAVAAALEDAAIPPRDIDYINAHATSTPLGDAFEARALRQTLGASLPEVPVSATKSMTGHLLSAASAVEAVIGLVALGRQAVPPTLNLEQVDPECADLRHVPHRAMAHPIEVVLSNSFGFGGSNTALLLGQAPADSRRAA